MTTAIAPEEAAIARLARQRFFLDADIMGNEYLLPVDRRMEWDAYEIACESFGDLLPLPAWAKPLKGQIRHVEFEVPEEVST